MAWELAYLSEQGVVAIDNSGELTPAALREQTDAALRLLRRHESFLCLVDCSRAKTRVSACDVIDLLRYYDQRGGDRRYRFGVVLPASGQSLEAYQLYETAGYNRGYRIRLFDERASALAWLASCRAGSGAEQEPDSAAGR